jgi:uncharacterized phage protein (TIGR01671 family)
MNELIKFRAWNKKCLSMHEVIILTKHSVTCRPEKFLENPIVLGYKEFELMQFTGLKDKNNIEVYVGDIIESDSGLKYDVRFGEWSGSIGFYVDTKSALGDYPIGSDNYNGINTAIKVIGNIYENPELTTP